MAEHRGPATAAAAVQVELENVRRQLSTTAWGVPVVRTNRFIGLMIGTVLLWSWSVGWTGLGLLAIGTGDPAVAAVFLILALPTVWPALRLTRKTLAMQRPVNVERATLLARERQLVAMIPAGAQQVPGALRLDRQPSPFAQMMWARMQAGRSPEQALLALPDDAPAWLVWFHRRVGWGTVAAAGSAMSILLGYIGLRVAAG